LLKITGMISSKLLPKLKKGRFFYTKEDTTDDIKLGKINKLLLDLKDENIIPLGDFDLKDLGVGFDLNRFYLICKEYILFNRKYKKDLEKLFKGKYPSFLKHLSHVLKTGESKIRMY
jgi:hypothetical protein